VRGLNLSLVIKSRYSYQRLTPLILFAQTHKMNPEELRQIVVCFLFDGSEKYLRMTLNAVNSFISTTPHIKVGLLFPAGYDETIVLRQLTDASRASVRRYHTHFQSWNPTQHKLDIIKFSDEYNTIFWLDSDAIVYQDLTDLLWRFHVSPCKVAFMKDHVCFNPQFLNSWIEWRKVSDPFIPQASFMGFKKDIMPPFFKAWEECWRTWIEPVPFINYPNPLPSFAGSAFCTEQYALGMVLESTLLTRADVYELRRITFPLKGAGAGTGSATGLSADLTTQYSEKTLSENELALLEDKFKSQLSFSSWGGETSFSGVTSWGSSWLSSFSGETSLSSVTSWTGSAEFFSFSSWTNIYPEFSFSFSSWETLPSSFSGSAEFGRTSLSFENFSSSARGIWAPVDNIEGKIVHFYSTFYDQSNNWWQRNSQDAIPQINQYWDNRNQRPVYTVTPATSQVFSGPHTSPYSPPPRVSPPKHLRKEEPGL